MLAVVHDTTQYLHIIEEQKFLIEKAQQYIALMGHNSHCEKLLGLSPHCTCGLEPLLKRLNDSLN